MMGVLRQPLAQNFGKAQLTFHDTKHLFDFGAHFRLMMILGPIIFAGRGKNRMNQLTFAIDTNMGPHAETPLITF